MEMEDLYHLCKSKSLDLFLIIPPEGKIQVVDKAALPTYKSVRAGHTTNTFLSICIPPSWDDPDTEEFVEHSCHLICKRRYYSDDDKINHRVMKLYFSDRIIKGSAILCSAKFIDDSYRRDTHDSPGIISREAWLEKAKAIAEAKGTPELRSCVASWTMEDQDPMVCNNQIGVRFGEYCEPPPLGLSLMDEGEKYSYRKSFTITIYRAHDVDFLSYSVNLETANNLRHALELMGIDASESNIQVMSEIVAEWSGLPLSGINVFAERAAPSSD